MEDDHNKEKTINNLLEEPWFFGNSLIRKAKCVKCKRTILFRTPSLPSKLDGGDEEEECTRMCDLIRQAMSSKIDKMSSLPPKFDEPPRKEPTKSEITRVSSMDPSLLLSANQSSKDVKNNISAPQHYSKEQKNKAPLHSSEEVKNNLSTPKHFSEAAKASSSAPSTSGTRRRTRSERLNRRPRKLEIGLTLRRLDEEEVKGFEDLGFKFNNEDLSPTVVGKIASLRLKEKETENEGVEVDVKGKRILSPSEAWNGTQSKWNNSLQIPTRININVPPEELKAQLKLWAKAVAASTSRQQ